MSTTAFEAYKNDQIEAADPLELVCLLYRGALDAVKKARVCLREDRIKDRSRQVSRATEIIGELSFALDPHKGGEVARNLAELYVYMVQRLTEGNIQQTDPPLAEVESLLQTLLEGWEQCRVGASAAPNAMTAYPESAPIEYAPISLSA